jgi:hypothetical protein
MCKSDPRPEAPRASVFELPAHREAFHTLLQEAAWSRQVISPVANRGPCSNSCRCEWGPGPSPRRLDSIEVSLVGLGHFAFHGVELPWPSFGDPVIVLSIAVAATDGASETAPRVSVDGVREAVTKKATRLSQNALVLNDWKCQGHDFHLLSIWSRGLSRNRISARGNHFQSSGWLYIDDRDLPLEVTHRQGLGNEAAMTRLIFAAGTK